MNRQEHDRRLRKIGKPRWLAVAAEYLRIRQEAARPAITPAALELSFMRSLRKAGFTAKNYNA